MGSGLTAKDVLVEAGARGAEAAGSDKERDDLLRAIKVFGSPILEEVRDGDFPGILAGTYVYRAGKRLGVGVILTLQGRAVIAWMVRSKGFLKRPSTEVVPIASIRSVELGRKRVTGMAEPMPAIFLAAAEDWELLCSPDVPAEAPLYELLLATLNGSINPEQWPPDGVDAALG